MVAILHLVGTLALANIPLDVRVGVCAVAAVVGVVLDIRAVVLRRFSVGPSRQTPKQLMHRANRHQWLIPLLWGVDTGLLVTTYRVSFASWVLLLSALFVVAPPWAGLAYGVSFAAPLTLSMLVGDTAVFGRSGDRLRVRRPQLAQLGGSVVMVALPSWIFWSYYAPWS
jgi:hypothetical protein